MRGFAVSLAALLAVIPGQPLVDRRVLLLLHMLYGVGRMVAALSPTRPLLIRATLQRFRVVQIVIKSCVDGFVRFGRVLFETIDNCIAINTMYRRWPLTGRRRLGQ